MSNRLNVQRAHERLVMPVRPREVATPVVFVASVHGHALAVVFVPPEQTRKQASATISATAS
jgi:hypothetical protein